MFNERLYGAFPENLNDPFEGWLNFDPYIGAESNSDPPNREIAAAIQLEVHKAMLGQIRICCLSKTFHHPLLWSHYADGHKGLCFEVNLPDGNPNIREIEYVDDVSALDCAPKSLDEYIRLLTIKSSHWKHEQEVRAIPLPEYLNIKKNILRVICGSRMPLVLRRMIQCSAAECGIPLAWARLNRSKGVVEI
ncbi:MAG: DUF2971 domain-containing protein [Candidatus Krumholzibacteriota bacterium]|nr:DUF2971 domain-containing protein [Candidatus Krumholzibacteriota bacterium]